MLHLGLGKTLYNSSVGVLEKNRQGLDLEIALSERLLRKKASGAWPEKALRTLESRWVKSDFTIAENRDVIAPLERERTLDQAVPFFDYLKREGLDRFSSRFNRELAFVTHHLSHASAATVMSPFEKAVVVVIDGAGSAYQDFPSGSLETSDALLDTSALGGVKPKTGIHEECSVYLMDQGRLRSVFKRWRRFEPSTKVPKKTFSEGVGIFYESVAEYVFDSNRSSGKVMGLAPFGRPRPVTSRIGFLEELDWSQAFKGKGKKAWDESGRFQHFADVSASVQAEFENDLWKLLEFVREKWPGYENCIITGGCALNCTFNAKLLARGLFSGVYVPPFPGDESIGLGAASWSYLNSGEPWAPFSTEAQHGFFGPRASVPSDESISSTFREHRIERPASITEFTAAKLAKGEVIGWFQDRSESGPRALGHRSILADPSRPGLKDKLNSEIKFREDFRPYGCSCLHEKADEYFEIPKGFDNPYMSFAVRTRPAHLERLSQVTHVDGTSRMQTVRASQNRIFHELIEAFGRKTGLHCVLNTSLNVMGEPIVETVEDAKNFLEKTPVDGLAIGPYFITRGTRE